MASSFYIDVLSMLKDYGVDIKVYSASADKQDKPNLIGGIPVDDDDDGTQAPPEERHEPVVPVNSMTSQLAVMLSGGVEKQADLLWLSSKLYPINTVVEVPTQGQKYKVTSYSNYQDYSQLVVYQLKGDDHHPNG